MEGTEMVTLTKAELKAYWKQMYQTRKDFSLDGPLPDDFTYGYFTGKMEYTAWLLLLATGEDEVPTKRPFEGGRYPGDFSEQL